VIASDWPILRGQTLKRQELHALVGGSHQWGITSCLGGTNILVFTNPRSAKKFGYDIFEGLQRTGIYTYTGQGQVGDQSVEVGSNRTLLSTQWTGRPIRLFRVDRTEVTYFGRYRLSNVPFRYETAPDLNGVLRQVVVFNLHPDD